MNIYEFLKTGVLEGLSLNDTEESLYQKFDKEILGKKLYPDSSYKDVFYFYAFGGTLEICVISDEVSHFNVTAYQGFFFLEYNQKKHYLSEFNNFHEFAGILDIMGINWHFFKTLLSTKKFSHHYRKQCGYFL